MGAVCFSTKAIFIKLAYKYNVDAITMLMLRMLFALPFYIAVLIFDKIKHKTQKIENKIIIQIIILGFFGYYLASFLDMYGLQYITANLERLILFVYPTIVLFFGKIFFKRKIYTIQIIAILISYGGILIAFYSDNLHHQIDVNYYKGAIAIFLSAICYAFYLSQSDTAISKIGTIQFTCYSMIVSAIAVLLHYIFKNGFHIQNYVWQVYMYGAIIAIFATVLPTFLMNNGIKYIGSNNMSIIGSVGPIATILMSFYILKEPISITHWLGTFLVLLGVFLISIKGKK